MADPEVLRPEQGGVTGSRWRRVRLDLEESVAEAHDRAAQPRAAADAGHPSQQVEVVALAPLALEDHLAADDVAVEAEQPLVVTRQQRDVVDAVDHAPIACSPRSRQR